jgi:NOL1/NOP2/fmu family ribosome biogenesis protein
VVGAATGELYGNALRWQYVLKLDIDGRVWEVDFDDWMYLMDDKVMLNKAAMSKFGIYLGEVTLAFYKR